MNSPDTRTVGRAAACDLVLDDPSVSMLHARLALSGDGFLYIEDAGSRNGTFLTRNGRQVRALRTTLCAGDALQFGDLEVPAEQLTRLFREDRRLRLRQRPVFRRAPAPQTEATTPDAPRRDPLTGALSTESKENRTE